MRKEGGKKTNITHRWHRWAHRKSQESTDNFHFCVGYNRSWQPDSASITRKSHKKFKNHMFIDVGESWKQWGVDTLEFQRGEPSEVSGWSSPVLFSGGICQFWVQTKDHTWPKKKDSTNGRETNEALVGAWAWFDRLKPQDAPNSQLSFATGGFLRYHYIPTRMVKMKRIKNTSDREVRGQPKLSYTADGDANWHNYFQKLAVYTYDLTVHVLAIYPI